MKTLYILISIILLDIIWFSISYKHIYEQTLFNIQGEHFDIKQKMIGGLIAWSLLSLGLTHFVIKSKDKKENAKNGLIFGFIVYGIYNFTNYTIFKNYDNTMLFGDLLWGMFLCSFISYIYT